MAIKIQGNSKFQGKSVFAAFSPTPTYTVTSNAVNSADEGTVITFTLNTTNVGNGTVLPYTITGISANDVTSGSLTGSFTVSNNLATATITLSSDLLTEGTETATLALDNGFSSVSVVVNDTSMAPTYSITKNKSTVLEGASVIFTLNTTNVSNGTVLPYTITGVSASDLTSGSLTGNFTVDNNIATTTIMMAADQSIEGVETATLTLDNAAASSFVLVNDSFVNESFQFEVNGNTSEGNIVTIDLITNNVPVGATIPYTITGVTSEDINGASLTGNFNTYYDEENGRNLGYITLSFAPDFITEGTETLTLTLDNRSVSFSVQINDTFTSAPPTYTHIILTLTFIHTYIHTYKHTCIHTYV